MEVKGVIKEIGETKTFGNNGFRTRSTVITTDEQYPQYLLIEFVQDKTDLLNDFEVGSNVSIGINLRGREWISPQGETKYFNSIQGWRIEEAKNDSPSQNETQNSAPTNNNPIDADDDLPF